MEKLLNELKNESILTQEELLFWIPFIQHERLVHLIVTLFFALLGVLFLLASLMTEVLAFVFLFAICIILDVFYIRHYYILENGVQELYFRLRSEHRNKKDRKGT